jgi:hypothetical protein
MTLKGRHWVMLWLVVALVVLGTVTARQTLGYSAADALRVAREERAGLEARRGELERRIHQASSRQVLVPRANAALGLHEPAASEMTVFVMPGDLPGGLPAEVTSPPRDTARSAPPARPRTVTRAPARKPAAKPATRRPAARSTTRRP